ncbi:MAG TPA: 3-hydroxyacyl-CoA dehydrogenase family protein [Burkholderiales bacterium]|jgi:3-hydroxybutyryl-CoA dehydrogenase|nr:3-hydroxyacyl-CoA dehydrogenase family protein [Burkholderiales bacterium]
MIQKVGVVGAGLMGSEIALVFALAGRDVLLSDTSEDNLKRAKDNLAKILEKGVGRGFYKADDVQPALGRLQTTTDLSRYADRDLVIEAVFESEPVKAEVFRKLDGICRAGCIIASNTSTISITALSAYVGAGRRRDFLGTHFFSPVSRMKLVEVIPALDTAPETVDVVIEACKQAAKTPIRVKDVVGFAVNRLLHAFMIEAVRLVEEGVATPEEVDLACKLGLGHPVGPFELSDAVTNNLSLQVQEILHGAYGPRFLPRPLLKSMVQAGYNGKKAGRGWYKYEKK